MTIMKDIDYGCLLEILSRLPVKSLLRFMCACKNWNTLISSHHFRKVHREKHSSSPPLLIAYYDDFDIVNPPYKPNDDNMNTYLLTLDLEGKLFEKVTLPFPRGAMFGMTTPAYQSKLLCFDSLDTGNLFYLYYPSTRKSFQLNKPPSFLSPDFEMQYGALLGYIPSKDEYIMVLLVKLSNGKIYCEVLDKISISCDKFELHYNRWRSSKGQATTIIGNISGHGAFVGGVFYWQAVCAQNKNNGFILAFDPETDCFSNLNYPEDLTDIEAGLLELKGDLYLIKFPVKSSILVLWKSSKTSENKYSWTRYWMFDFNTLFGFRTREQHPGFRWQLFIYNLKYLKGYEEQPRDDQVLAEMGKLNPKYKLPSYVEIAAVHTNLFTL